MHNNNPKLYIKFLLFFIFLSSPLYTIESNALPTPLSNQQLNQQSDLIAKVKVLGVTRVGYTNKAIKFQAWLKIIKTIKGKAEVNDTILVTWHRFDKKLIGSWEIAYYPGEKLITYLVWDNNEKAYKNISWNSVKKIQSTNKKLPIKDGAVEFNIAP